MQRMEFDKCVTFHYVQIEETEKVANAVEVTSQSQGLERMKLNTAALGP